MLNGLLDSITNLDLDTIFLALIFLTIFFNDAGRTPQFILIFVRLLQMFAIVGTAILLGSFFVFHGYELIMSIVRNFST